MTIIAGKENTEIAYLHNNCILVPGTHEVLGVILGGSVFGRNGIFKGKLLNHTIYSSNGEMLATGKESTSNEQVDFSDIRQQSWQVINSIQNHNTPWVTPKNTWAKDTLPEFLLS